MGTAAGRSGRLAVPAAGGFRTAHRVVAQDCKDCKEHCEHQQVGHQVDPKAKHRAVIGRFTDLTLAGRINVFDAQQRVSVLLTEHLDDNGVADRNPTPFLIRWHISGLYNGLPFEADVEQDYYAESYSFWSF